MKIAVLTAYFGGIDHEHLTCMRELFRLNGCTAGGPGGQPEEMTIRGFELANMPWLDMAQSYLVDTTLEAWPDVDVLFWTEHDMIFQPVDVLKMSRLLLESPEYDMIGAAYSQRTPGGKIVGGLTDHKTLEFYGDKVYPAHSLGFGFTASKPSAYLKLRETLKPVHCPAFKREIYPYFAHLLEPMYLGQDTSFFVRLADAGGKVAVDANPRVFHRGMYNYAIEDTGLMVPRFLGTLTINNEDPKPKVLGVDK